MNKHAEKFVGAIIGLETARFLEQLAFIPYRHGQVIEPSNISLLYWGILVAINIGAAYQIYLFFRSISNERQPATENELESAKNRFLNSESSVAFSSTWLGKTFLVLALLWGGYVLASGEANSGSVLFGHWFSGGLLLFVASFLSGWSVKISPSGETLVFRRYAMVTGNLKLSEATTEMANSGLFLRSGSARYRIPIRRLARSEREVVCRVFERSTVGTR